MGKISRKQTFPGPSENLSMNKPVDIASPLLQPKRIVVYDEGLHQGLISLRKGSMFQLEGAAGGGLHRGETR